jgi:nitric-oxide synthase
MVIEPKTAFDVLPLIIESPEEGARLYELPAELLLQVDIRHPKNEAFNTLGLKWYTCSICVSRLSFS